MIQSALRLDAALAWSRPAWSWLGQLALVILGVHLAADQLDDLVLKGLLQVPFPWRSPDTPIFVASGLAVFLELLVDGWAAMALARGVMPVDLPLGATLKDRFARVSVRSVVAPLFWAPTALAGAWVLSMATEDALYDLWPPIAAPLGWLVGGLCVWRLGATGLLRVLRTDAEGKRWAGLAWSPLLLLFAGLAAWYGLPLWGWL